MRAIHVSVRVATVRGALSLLKFFIIIIIIIYDDHCKADALTVKSG